jgi:hypothetical protein
MQVRVNPNWSFKRVTRVTHFLAVETLRLAAKFFTARLNVLRYLMPKKKGESDAPPKFTSHEHPSIFSKIDDKTRRTLLFDKHFSNGVIYP